MSTKPASFDVEALLLAAGVERPTPAQRERVRRALVLYGSALFPRTTEARNRWRMRATRLRDRYAPHLDWGSAELLDDPDAS